MEKDELISKLSTFIRNENFAKIDEIIKNFREDYEQTDDITFVILKSVK